MQKKILPGRKRKRGERTDGEQPHKKRPNNQNWPMKFDLFDQLPLEIQLVIWEIFIDNSPKRVVHLSNDPLAAYHPVLFQIDHKRKFQATEMLGYVHLDIPSLHPELFINFKFHPAHDLVLMDYSTPQLQPRTVKLEYAMKKIKSVAIPCRTAPSVCRELNKLRDLQDLELVFLITRGEHRVDETNRLGFSIYQPDRLELETLAMPNDDLSIFGDHELREKLKETVRENLERGPVDGGPTRAFIPCIEFVCERYLDSKE